MERNNQQIIQKSPLPKKTKIAAWWIIITGLLILAWDSSFYLPNVLTPSYYAGDSAIIILFSSLAEAFFIIPAYFLLKRKRWAWFVLVVGSFGLTIFSGFFVVGTLTTPSPHYAVVMEVFFFFFPRFIKNITSIVLLFLGRKNFFKITS